MQKTFETIFNVDSKTAKEMVEELEYQCQVCDINLNLNLNYTQKNNKSLKDSSRALTYKEIKFLLELGKNWIDHHYEEKESKEFYRIFAKVSKQT